MNHITLFSIATLGLAIFVYSAGASACDVHGEDYSAMAAPQLAATTSESLAADIKTFQFRPKVIEVHAGATVTWTNQDNIEHTVTSGTPDAPDKSFTSGAFGKGQSFSATLDKPGEYTYFCAKHNSMRGTVKVLPPE